MIRGKRKVGASIVCITFDDSRKGTIKITNEKGNTFPHILEISKQEFIYIEDICLKITGGSEFSETGKYQIAVFPKDNI